MKTAVIILLSIFSFTNVSCQEDRTKSWARDIDYLLTEIKKQHYIYKNKELPPIMLQQSQALKNRIGEFSDERILVELQGLMYHLGDGHSYMLPLGSQITESHFLPLHLYQFSDGIFVIDADDSHASLVGMKVKSIGSVAPEKIMQDLVTFISQDNVIGAKWIGPVFMRSRGMLERYGLAKGAESAVVRFEDRQGKTIETAVPFVVPRNFRGIPKMVPVKNAPADKSPLYLANVGDNFWFRYMPENKAVYFQFNQVMNKENETLSAFAARLDVELMTKKASLLIVDVRHNNGGNGDLTPPLINVLKGFERSQQGKIIILTGRNTFSAAQIFISRVDKETGAVFAGEPSSSKPNFVGEENEVVLPYSGARGSISNRYHENIPGDTRQWIAPELELQPSSNDYFANKDSLLDAVFRKYAK